MNSFADLCFTTYLNHYESWLLLGADISPTGRKLALTNYDEGWSWSKPNGISWAEFLKQSPTPCNLRLKQSGPREAITVTERYCIEYCIYIYWYTNYIFCRGYWTTSENRNQPLFFHPSSEHTYNENESKIYNSEPYTTFHKNECFKQGYVLCKFYFKIRPTMILKYMI